MALDLMQAISTERHAAQDIDRLRHVFAQITAESCPYTYNFHMHTVHSDGKLQPEELMKQAIAIGLKDLAITDHHSVGGYRIAQAWLENYSRQNSNLLLPYLWSGLEVNANLLDTEVHILCYGFDPDHPALQPYLQRQTAQGLAYEAASVIAAIHRAGGLTVLAHPSRYKLSAEDLILAAAALGIDGIEAFYAYNNPCPWRASPQQTEVALDLSDRLRLLRTCGTDTHGTNLLQRL